MSAAVALLGASVVVAAWLNYLWRIPREQVPAHPRVHTAAMWLGIALGAVALVVDGWRGAALALDLVVTWPSAAFFLWLLTQARLPDGELTVAVGEPLPAFEAPTDTGAPWSPPRGQRILLKFFRGRW